MSVAASCSWGFWACCLIALAPAPASAHGGVSCAISTTALAFGQYVPSRSGASDFTATVEVRCTASGTTSVPIDGSISLAGAGGYARRELTDGPNRLRYQLFLDPARTILWGDGSGGTHTKPISGVVGATAPFRETVVVYGRILARQSDAVVGNYTDQIIAVLNY